MRERKEVERHRERVREGEGRRGEERDEEQEFPLRKR
jgi:hypothetical protein